MGHIHPALIDRPGYKCKRLLRALPPDCDDNLKLTDPAAAAVAAAFLLLVPGLVGTQKDIQAGLYLQ